MTDWVITMREMRTKEHYSRLRAKGHSHGRALHGVAGRLLKTLVALLERGELFDPSRHVAQPV